MQILLIGNGVRGYENILYKFIKKNKDYIVMVTWRTIDIVPEALRPGIKGQKKANKLMNQATEVLCIGTRLHIGQRGYNGEFAPNAKITVVDIDQNELDKLPKEYIKICKDAGEFLLENL